MHVSRFLLVQKNSTVMNIFIASHSPKTRKISWIGDSKLSLDVWVYVVVHV